MIEKKIDQLQEQEVSQTQQINQKLIKEINTQKYPQIAKQEFVQNISCPKNLNAIYGCTNKKCASYPFLCKQYQHCHSCEQNHHECVTFIKIDKLFKKIYQKKNKPQKVTSYINTQLQKWIDFISDSLQKIQNILESYGLTQTEQQIIKLIQSKQHYKISSQKLYQVSQSVQQTDTQPNIDEQLLQEIQKQCNKTRQQLQKGLKFIPQIIKAANEGKLKHKIFKIQAEQWKFNSRYHENTYFLFQNNDSVITRADDIGKYHHMIGTVPFDTKNESQFSVMIKKSANNCIMFGIGPNNIQISDSHNNKNCTSYWAYDGSIWANRIKQTGGVKLISGDIVTIKYEPQHKKVVWMKNYTPVSHFKIPEQMTIMVLYPIFGILTVGDELQVFYQKPNSKKQ